MDQFSNHPLYKRHNMDSAMSSLWEFYKNKFLSLFFISLAMSLIIQYASTMVDLKEFSTITDPVVMLEKLKEFILPIIIVSLINLLFTAILQYYIIYNPLGNENNIFISALKSLKYFIPYLIIVVLLAIAGSIAIALGFLALVVGAFLAVLYIMTLYLFILPIMMVEGTNIFDTIGRTFKLAHKNFWVNIGWVAVFLIILIVISVIFSAIILLPFTGDFVKTIVNPQEGSNLINDTTNPLFIILSALVSALTLPLLPIFAAILYFNGRANEEQGQMVRPENPQHDRIRVEDLYAKPYSDDHPDNPEKKELS
jgi:hypothetical protein